jgi:hypothetical protein
MKILILATLLIIGSPLGFADVIDFEERELLKPFPRITGDSESVEGKTDNESVRCLLTTGNINAEFVSVTGTMTVRDGLIDPERGVHLTAFHINGNTQHTVASWEIAGREKNGEVQYEFRIGGDLTKTASLYLFTKEGGMMVLELKTLPINELKR